MANKKFGAHEVMDCVMYDLSNNRPVAAFDTLKISSLDFTVTESVSARGGKGNAKIISWDGSREGTLTLQDALLSNKGIELLTGNAILSGAQKVYMRQDTVWEQSGSVMVDKGSLYPLTASGSGAISLAFTPNETAANILVYDASDDCGTPLAAGTLSGKTLTNVAWANKQVIVYYSYNAPNSQVYTVTADKFAGTYRIVGDTVIRNASTGKDEAFQVVINNAKVDSAFKLEFKSEGDPAPFDMNVEILRESGSTRMVTMTQYDYAVV